MNNNEDIIEIPSDDYDVNGEYDKNPFIYKMGKIKVKKKNITVHRGEMLMNSEGSEFTTNICQTFEVDQSEFIKIYSSHIKVYFDLSQTAFKLFFVLIGLIQKEIGKDRLYINHSIIHEASAEYGKPISRSVYYRAMDELQNKRIIAKSSNKFIYYINPNILFNGDRARFIKEIKIRHEQTDVDDNNNT